MPVVALSARQMRSYFTRFHGRCTPVKASMKRAASSLVSVSHIQDGVVRLTLNHPAKRNALSYQLLCDLHDALAEVGADQEARCVIIGAEGPVFCSGHDLSELQKAQQHVNHNTSLAGEGPPGPATNQIFQKCSDVMQLIQSVPIPVVAEVRGLATAAGCQLVATCDLAVAGVSAKFGTPGVKIGLFCTTPGVAIARAIPRKQALRMLFTGDLMSAHDAWRFGLVSDVVPDETVATRTLEIAQRISEASRPVLGLGKSAYYQQVRKSVPDAYRYASDMMVSNLHGVLDSHEGIGAFLEKRAPNWKHG